MDDEHQQGTMDINQQEKTFAGFMTITKWIVIGIVCLLAFLALFRT